MEDIWEIPAARRALAYHNIGEVFALMNQHGISQREIARSIEMSQGEVSQIVRGHRQVQAYDLLERIAMRLGLLRGWLGLAFDEETTMMMVTGRWH